MTANQIALQIRGLRAQLDVLESHLRQDPEKHCTLADLRGLVTESQSTEADIDSVLYRGPKSQCA